MQELNLKECRIRIERGILDRAGAEVRDRLGDKASRAFLVTDSNVRAAAARVEISLRKAGYDVAVHELPPGEEQKTLDTVRSLYEAMLRLRMDRRCPVVGVGGGVIGDLTAFTASTFLRGLPMIQVPTTLLAQVDASIGGKTGVDFGGYKNIVGTFQQAASVLIDVTTLSTLPEREFRTGMAEVVKYGVIRDEALFGSLEKQLETIQKRDSAVLEEVVARCAAIKVDVVNADEREGGLREILNYGHTVGHAVEAAEGFTGHSHGEAVAIGMAVEAHIAVAQALTGPGTATRMEKLLKRCGLPIRVPKELPQEKMLQAILVDKKTRGGKPRFVLPEKIGHVRFGMEVPEEVVKKALTIQ